VITRNLGPGSGFQWKKAFIDQCSVSVRTVRNARLVSLELLMAKSRHDIVFRLSVGKLVSDRLKPSMSSKRKQWRALPLLVLVSVLSATLSRIGQRLNQWGPPATYNQKYLLSVVVLTADRPRSLGRLLSSLARVDYRNEKVNIIIHIDVVKKFERYSENCESVALATEFKWRHGHKFVTRSVSNKGLAESWFGALYSSDSSYIAIFEDDMEVSSDFYNFFHFLQNENVFSDTATLGLCLHPGDWEVRTREQCDSNTSDILYLSPEPCNWGPIWKQEEWRKYIDWVHAMKFAHEMPMVEDSIKYNFNEYLKKGWDVQSPWLWRYTTEFSKYQVRYAFDRCSIIARKVYFAINHKEVGLHFKARSTSSGILSNIPFERAKTLLREKSMHPSPFLGHEYFAHSLRGTLH